MAVQPQNFLSDFQKFMTASLSWCKNESEKESNAILLTLQNVMEDVKRRSKMSAVAEAALVDAHAKLTSIMSEAKYFTIDELHSELQSLKSDNAEVNRLVNPVVEALQFQDKLVQNLQNLEKMILIWFEFESQVQSTNAYENPAEMTIKTDQLLKKLLKATTTADERNLVRKHFSTEERESKLEKSA